MRQYEVIPEPDLYFGGNRGCIDPQVGMLAFGPHGGASNDVAPPRRIVAGVIGTQRSMNSFELWLKFFGNRITDVKRKGSRYRHLDFPGISLDGPLRFEISVTRGASLELDPKLVEAIEADRSRRRRIMALAREYVRLLDVMTEADPKPEIVFLPLDEVLTSACSDPRLKSEHIRFRERSFGKSGDVEDDGAEEPPVEEEEDDDDDDAGLFDFHNFLKAQAAIRGFTTQILLPGTMTFAGDRQTPAVIGWNIAVGVYYKATGMPWKLAEIDDRTCYIGVSFYQDLKRNGGVMRASIAQVYMRSGESQVIRGAPFRWNPYQTGRQVHIDRERMAELVESGVQLYRDARRGELPDRVVVHKPSAFWEEELAGCEDGAKGVRKLDTVYISEFNGLRGYHEGEQYSVVRGTMIGEKNEAMLFTSGFVPALGTSLGTSTPAPIRIVAQRMDSSLKQIGADIMGLTKLDWNSSAFATRLPVTISVSRKVGAVMAELASVTKDPPPSYKFYM